MHDVEKSASNINHALVLSGFAFMLHFVWESIQCTIFFVHGSYDATWRGMMVAALGDVALTWAIYMVVATVSRKWRWVRQPWHGAQFVALFSTALALGTAVELRALHKGLWGYTKIAPLVPILRISIVPLLQLLLLTPLLFKMVERCYRTDVRP